MCSTLTVKTTKKTNRSPGHRVNWNESLSLEQSNDCLRLESGGGVPSRPAAGTRNKVGTPHPSASICSPWAEQLAFMDLQSNFSQTFFCCVSLAEHSNGEPPHPVMDMKEGSWCRTPEFSKFHFFRSSCFFSCSNSPPVEASFGHRHLLQKKKKKIT